MSKNEINLLNDVSEYVARQFANGSKTVYRTYIWAVMEDRNKWGKFGKQLTVELLQEAARINGAVYINDNGRARIVKEV